MENEMMCLWSDGHSLLIDPLMHVGFSALSLHAMMRFIFVSIANLPYASTYTNFGTAEAKHL